MGFLESYEDFASEITISPRIFHKAVGYSVLSAIIGRWAYVNRGVKRIYPNLYHLIIAPASVGKTSAIDVGKSLIVELNEARILSGDTSDEAMVMTMIENPDGIFIEDEFSKFLHQCKKEYSAQVKDTLTECYDSPAVKAVPKRMKNKIEGVIRYPAPSFLGACTEVALTRTMDASDLQTGFFSRFVFYTANRPDKSTSDIRDEEDHEKRSECLFKIRKILKMLYILERPSALTFTGNAKSEYILWSRAWERDSCRPEYSAIESNLNRLKMNVVKYAMLNALNREDLVISADDVLKAEEIANMSRRSIIDLLMDYDVGQSKFSMRLAMARRRIRLNAMEGRNTTMVEFNQCFDDPREMDRALEALKRQGRISVIASRDGNVIQWLDAVYPAGLSGSAVNSVAVNEQT